MALNLVNVFQKLSKWFKRPANNTSGITFLINKRFTIECTPLNTELVKS